VAEAAPARTPGSDAPLDVTLDVPLDRPLDRIVLTGIRVRGNHGVYDFERRDGQEFVVDATVELDAAPAAAADEVAETVHYGVLAEQIAEAVSRDPVDLIETLAERIAAVVLSHPAARRAHVTVHKPDAPISVPFGDVAVSITRSRQAEPGNDGPRASEPVRDVVLALGSNLGDREGTLRDALADLKALPGVEFRRASALVETPALTLSGIDESAPAYLNAVALVRTALSPHALLDALQAIEQGHGRQRGERWGDRTLDIDMVAYGDDVSSDDRLTLPHPRAHERAFVLVPWLQVDPQAVLPGRGRVSDLLPTTTDPVRFYGETAR
jgi:dihydroneopterin aldolase/2-amino-4-hydroxy-6-hydroxymethyldihydropteridine diphosphokinase